MADNEVAQLFADLILRTSGFQAGLNEAVTAAQRAGQEMQNAFGANSQRAINDTRSTLGRLAADMAGTVGDGSRQAAATAGTVFRQLGSDISTIFGRDATRSFDVMDRAFRGATDNMANNFRNVGNIVQGILISQLFYRSLNAIEEASSAVLDFSKNLEQATVAFSMMLGSGQRAQRFLEELKTFAAVTPFTFDSAREGAQRLMAMGFAAENVIPTLRTLSDTTAIMGGGTEKLNRIILALGQIKTAGVVRGSELRQFSEAGVPALQILQEELGLTAAQVSDIGKLKIQGDLGVEALLRGMQKRFGGAGDQISKTLGGMSSTIKDDMLIVSEAIFRGPYGALKSLATQLVTFTNMARTTLKASGVGGLFEKLVPPGLQQSLRTIIGAFQSLGQSLAILWSAVKPIVTLTVEYLVKGFAMVAPVVAGVARAVAVAAAWMTGSSRAVRVFGAALLSLMAASVVVGLLMKLAAVFRLVMLAQVAAQAVLRLATAVRVLMLALTTHPIVAIVTIVAAAILGIAMSSETASKWLDALMQRLSKLTGVNTGSILQPGTVSDVNKDMNEFNQSLIDTSKNLTGTGAAADKSKKKVDNWLAAFDEVYSIPDQLDDVSSGIGDMGAGLGDFKLPELKMGTEEAAYDPTTSIRDQLKNAPPILLPKFEWPQMPQPPSIPPGTAAVVTEGFFADVNARMSAWAAQLQGLFNGLWTPLVNATNLGLAASKLALDGWLATIPVSILNAVPNFAAAFNALFASVGTGVSTTFANATNTITNWLQSIPTLVSTNTPAVVASFATMLLGVGTSVANAFVSARDSVVNWLVGIPTWISEQTASIVTSFGTLLSQVGSSIATSFATARDTVYNWLVSIPTWVSEQTASITTSFSTLLGSIGTEIVTAFNAAKDTVTNWLISIPTWVAENKATAVTSFNTFMSSIGTEITTGFNNAKDTIVNWAKSIPTWISENTPNVVQSFTTFMGKVGEQVATGFSKAKETVVGWLKGIGAWIKEWTPTIETALLVMLGVLLAGLIVWVAGIPAAIGAGLAAIVLVFRNTFETDINNGIKTAFGKIPGMLDGITDDLKTTATKVASAVTGVFSNAFTGVKQMVAGIFGSGDVGSVKVALGGGAGNMNAYASGGIVTRDQIARVGEGNKREAIIPLEEGMAPFAAAVAGQLAGMIPAQQSNNDGRPTLYVANLIADDRGLKELERRMEVIRIQESQRKGV